jgi:hypothetical protein
MDQQLTIDGHILAIEPAPGGHVLRIVGPQGGQSIEIALTPQGPVLRLGSGAAVEVTGDLRLAGRTLTLHGREGVQVTSGGDVRVKANDDLRLDGERVLMNC